MPEDLRAQAKFGIIAGLIIQFIGGLLTQAGGHAHNIGFTLSIAGLTLVTWGCLSLMRIKGYPPALGILGVLPLVGVLVLLLLPVRK